LLLEILFNEGSTVSKGKVLLKINDLELQAQLSQALTKQKLAQETEYRAGKLLEKEAISKKNMMLHCQNYDHCNRKHNLSVHNWLKH
jgi:membrane fusion protein (multidrug efflux system)